MITFRQRDYRDLVGLFRRVTAIKRVPSLETMVRYGHVVKVERGLYRVRSVVRRIPRD